MRLPLAVLAAALVSTSAQAANIFVQDFSSGLGASESVGGTFAVRDGKMGQNGYNRFDYSYYDLTLDLTGVTDAQLAFDYFIQSEQSYDGFNVLASTTGVFNLPSSLLMPSTAGFYAPINTPLSKIGALALSGAKSGAVVFDLTQFAGGVVDLRFQFQADYAANGLGVRLDNLKVTGTPIAGVPEPATWAMMILGFGAAGSALRRRRAVVASPSAKARSAPRNQTAEYADFRGRWGPRRPFPRHSANSAVHFDKRLRRAIAYRSWSR